MWARQGRAGMAEGRPHPSHTRKPRKAVRGHNFLTRSAPPPGKSGGCKPPPLQAPASALGLSSFGPVSTSRLSTLLFLAQLPWQPGSLPVPPHLHTETVVGPPPQAPSYLSTQITKELRLWLPPTASVSPSAGLADWGSLGRRGRRRRRPWSSTRPGSHPSLSGCQGKPDMK